MSRNTSTSILKKRLLHSFVFILALVLYPFMMLQDRILFPVVNALVEVSRMISLSGWKAAGFLKRYVGDPFVLHIGKPVAQVALNWVFRPLWQASAFLFLWSFLKPCGLLIQGVGLLLWALSSLASRFAATPFCQNVVSPLLVKPFLRCYFTLSLYVIAWPSHLLLYGVMTSIRTSLAISIALYRTLSSCFAVYDKGFTSLATTLMQNVDAYTYKVPVYTQSGVHAKLFGVKAKKVPKVRLGESKNDLIELPNEPTRVAVKKK